MATLFKGMLGLAVLVMIAVGALCSWIFLYTRDLPDIEHLSDFAPDSGNQVTDTCLPGVAFAVPFDRIGKPFRDALASAEPASSLADQIARTLMCTKMERSARYQLDVFRLSWQIRRRFSQEELFTIYVNRAYFGPAATGIENASDHFFQKSAGTLSIEEAALLAASLRGPMYSPTATWDHFSARPDIFLAKGHVKPFLGFADDQMKRLLGQKGQKNVHRAELEDKHGYDTKYAMHAIRLYGEAKELMEHGRITLPRPNREELIEIRRGKYSFSEIRQLGEQLESEALASQATSPLPDKVDRDAISRLLADAHLRFWSESTN